MIKTITSMSIVFVLFFVSLGLAQDITNKVIEKTDFDEQINKACLNHCQGNRRSAKLVLFEAVCNNNSIDVSCEVHFRNYHHEDTFVGGGFSLYDYTVKVKASGVLNPGNCELIVNNIDVIGDDALGLSKMAKNEEGKVYHIDNCDAIMEDLGTGRAHFNFQRSF